MNIKEKLKERLLEIPLNYTDDREKHSLAEDINTSIEQIEPYLKELCKNGILTEMIEYICPVCHGREILDDDLLNEYLKQNGEDGYFQCEYCLSCTINPKVNITGYIYYDIENRERLKEW